MQEGVFILWLVSLVVSLTSWLAAKVTFFRLGRGDTRRKITGLEMARQVLDGSGRHGMAIIPVTGSGALHRTPYGDKLLLPEKVYYGTKLSELSLALHEAGHQLTGSKSPIPAHVRLGAGRSLRNALRVSWVLVILGFLAAPFGWLSFFGRILFTAVFFLVLTGLREEHEATQSVLERLGKLEGFEVDELVRIGRLSKAVPWIAFGEILSVPFSFR